MFKKFCWILSSLCLLFLFTDIWSMEDESSLSNQILETNDLIINPILSIQPNSDLSFHQIQSIPHSFTFYDFLNTAEGEKFAELILSEKSDVFPDPIDSDGFKKSLDKLKSPIDLKKTTFNNFNIGSGNTASGYYALFNSYIIYKSIIARGGKVKKQTLKELYNFNSIANLFWDKNLNKDLRNIDIDGEWRKFVQDIRRNKKILDWYNSFSEHSATRKNLETAIKNYSKLKEDFKKVGMRIDFEDKNQGLSLDAGEIEEIVDSKKEVLGKDFFERVSVLDKNLLIKNVSQWEEKILPIFEDFKNQKNKIHLFILKENAVNWYSLIINKRGDKIQVILVDSANEFAINRLFLNQIFNVLELRPFLLILSRSPRQDENEKIAAQQKFSIENSSKQKENPVHEILIPQSTLKTKDYAGKLPEVVEKIINALNDSKLYSDYHEKISNKLLLHGPPGTGKSMLAKVIAGETNRILFEKNGGSFISMYQGSGAKSVEDLFENAKKINKPCVIFIDEIDGFSFNRKNIKNEDRQNALLLMLDKLDKLNDNENIFIIVATNNLDELDSAIKSRFNKRHFMPLPDFESRLKILEFRFNKIPADKKDFSNNFLKILSAVTQGLNVRDLIEMVKTTISYSIMAKKPAITPEDIVKAVCENKTIADKEKLKEKANNILYKIQGFSYYIGSSKNDSDTAIIKEMISLIDKEIFEDKKKQGKTQKDVWED